MLSRKFTLHGDAILVMACILIAALVFIGFQHTQYKKVSNENLKLKEAVNGIQVEKHVYRGALKVALLELKNVGLNDSMLSERLMLVNSEMGAQLWHEALAMEAAWKESLRQEAAGLRGPHAEDEEMQKLLNPSARKILSPQVSLSP